MNKNLKKLICAGGSALLIFGITSCSSESKNDANQEVEVTTSFLSKSDETTKAQDLSSFNSLEFYKDEFTSETTWSLPKRLEQAANLNDSLAFSFLMCQFSGCRKESPELLIQVIYSGKEWMFMESAIFKIGEETLELIPEERDKVRETLSAGYLFEAMTFSLTDQDYEFFANRKVNEEIRIRVSGSGLKTEETQFNSVEIEGLELMLSSYRHVRNEKISASNS
jgi:hypothetical protein